MFVEVANDLHAGTGDVVEISVPSGALLRISMLVYFLPVVALILGAAVGAALSDALAMSTTSASILVGVLAMGLSFMILKGIDRHARNRADYSPRMTRILSSASPPQRDDNRSGRTEDTASPL